MKINPKELQRIHDQIINDQVFQIELEKVWWKDFKKNLLYNLSKGKIGTSAIQTIITRQEEETREYILITLLQQKDLNAWNHIIEEINNIKNNLKEWEKIGKYTSDNLIDIVSNIKNQLWVWFWTSTYPNIKHETVKKTGAAKTNLNQRMRKNWKSHR